MANWAVELFGAELLTNGVTKATQDVLTGKKAVLIYFSAHWCPPCRGFTPMLVETYKNYTGRDAEIIFVSSDRDQSSFDDYFKEMPWAALPFADRGRKEKISSKFGVQGIPMLIVLNGEDGKVITEKGRGEVQSTKDMGKCLTLWGLGSEGNQETKEKCDVTEAAASWASEIFGDFIVTKDGKKAIQDVVAGKKAVLVYFSAHWCPPCRGFTPVLAEAYKNYRGGDAEIIFVSSDQDRSSFDDYFKEMPWAALPFADRERKEKISSKFGVQGIPMLVVLNGDDGKVVTENGRGELQANQDLGKCMSTWVGGKSPSNKKTCCCVIS